MERVTIPDVGTPVSRIGLGTWAFGDSSRGATDASQTARTILTALDLGVNLVDTAPVYGAGRAEEIVGAVLASSGRRDEVVLATKTGVVAVEGRLARDGSPARVARDVDDSLRRLRTDRIDLLQVHWPDPAVPLEETAAALGALVRAGKVRAVGVANFSPAQLDAFRKVTPVAALSPPYNLFERDVEADVLPYCRRNGIRTIVYGALCRGLLSGRLERVASYAGDPLRERDPKFRPPRYGQYLAAVAALDALAREAYGRTVLELAIRWLLDSGDVSVVLWGARRPSQVDPIRQVLGWSLDDPARARVDAIVRDHVRDPCGTEHFEPPSGTAPPPPAPPPWA
ncbi:MAG TPA: aldo/keto reductase [Anaeromyxobacteraceae bacterium]|nr:aldo/keto reductase [Anaeromyxobacteraceae bacterium]